MKKVFILLLFLITIIQSSTKADDISEFQIEGMSIGDSALNFISKEKLEKHKKDWFKSKNFSISADMNLNFLEIYDGLQVVYKTTDQKYKIEGIEAIKFFQKNINDCYDMLDDVVLDVKKILKSADISSMLTERHVGDTKGKTMVTFKKINMPNNDSIMIACYDWSVESGYWDQLRISIRTIEYSNFLSTKAY